VPRLNGLFAAAGIALDQHATFTLSQAHLFGQKIDGPPVECEIVDGDFLDLRDDLDAGALGKSNGACNQFSEYGASLPTGRGGSPPVDVEGRLAAMEFEGEGDRAIHVTQLSVTAALIGRGDPEDEVVERVMNATRRAAGAEGTSWDWNIEERAIRKMCADWVEKHPEIEERGAAPARGRLIVSSEEFVGGFTPPDYLFDGVLQRQFLYSLTGPTGTGKTCVAMRIAAHVGLGLPLASREVAQGKVLFFAGENPDDVRMRWIKLCEEMQIEPAASNVFWRAGSLDLSDKELRARIDAESAEHGPFALVIVDTSAAFFRGDDENSNVQLGAHARTLRSLVELPGGPTVIVTTHPTKTPNMDNLLPRGGGAFIAEVDGNLVCIKQPDSAVVELHWQGKLRGPDFPRIAFEITPGTTDRLVDSRGRGISTVTARPITEAERAEADEAGRRDQDALLWSVFENPDHSIAKHATHLAWFYTTGGPNTTKVDRTLKALNRHGLITKDRGDKWMLTGAGERVVGAPRPAPEGTSSRGDGGPPTGRNRPRRR
jgi:hypothetical protein